MEKLTAIIDIGSNSIRLVIYEINPGGSWKLVDDISDTVRLSENMVEGRFLNDFAMKKAVRTVSLFAKLCRSYKIQSKGIIAVATEAVRKAENKGIFVNMIKKTSGIHIRILTGDEEAYYSSLAVISSINERNMLIIDIGGGSTEITGIREGISEGRLSLPFGAVVVADEYTGRELPDQSGVARLDEAIRKAVLSEKWFVKNGYNRIAGLGGTVRTIAKIHRKQKDYPVDIIHNYEMDIKDFNSLYSNLSAMTLGQRKSIKGISEKRADIITGGSAILHSLAKLAGAHTLIVSGNGIREGILLEHLTSLNKFNALSCFSRDFDVLETSLVNFIGIYSVRKLHSSHVKTLTLSLFDQLSYLHRIDSGWRNILKTAAILHDSGIHLGYYGHCSHTFYMILNSRLNGLSHRELILVAAIAASHMPEHDPADYLKQYRQLLKDNDIDISRKLSIFLKLAECLDRGENGVVKRVDLVETKEKVLIRLTCNGDCELETELAEELSVEFKDIFNKTLSIQG